jgi:hypothetical protein
LRRQEVGKLEDIEVKKIRRCEGKKVCGWEAGRLESYKAVKLGKADVGDLVNWVDLVDWVDWLHLREGSMLKAGTSKLKGLG